MSAGPISTRKRDGKMKQTVGKSSLMGSFAASSSARCERLPRIESAWMRSAWPTFAPNFCDWTSSVARAFSSSRPVLEASSLQGVAPRFARAQLQVELPEFLADLLAGKAHLLADALDRRVQAHARLDADNEQVEGVGKAEGEVFFPFGNLARKPEVREVKACRDRSEESEHKGRRAHLPCREQLEGERGRSHKP